MLQQGVGEMCYNKGSTGPRHLERVRIGGLGCTDSDHIFLFEVITI